MNVGQQRTLDICSFHYLFAGTEEKIDEKKHATESTSEINHNFKKRYIVNFMYRRLQDIAIVMFKVKQRTCPIYIANLFKQYDEKTIV